MAIPITPCRRAVALATTALVAFTAAALPARADPPEPFPAFRGGDGYSYRREYRSREPQRGHEGFYGAGPNLRYCSYRRIPNRECSGGHCRVTGWTLDQFCY